MFTLTIQQLREHAINFWDDHEDRFKYPCPLEKLLELIELAYESGEHDGWYAAKTGKEK
jgi:hypothetical protein